MALHWPLILSPSKISLNFEEHNTLPPIQVSRNHFPKRSKNLTIQVKPLTIINLEPNVKSPEKKTYKVKIKISDYSIFNNPTR